MKTTISEKKTILHIFSSLPNVYNSRFYQFAFNNLPEFKHIAFAWNQQTHIRGSVRLFSKATKACNRLISITKLKKLAKKADVVVFHGFFYDYRYIVFFLLWSQEIFKKVVWSIWGGDLYRFNSGSKSFLYKLNEIFRRYFFSKLLYASSLIPGDSELLRTVYGFNGKIYKAFYPNPVRYDTPFPNTAKNTINKRLILIGNSSDPSNNHEIILTALRKVYDNSFGVYIPLAYGDEKYAERVQNLAVDFFGEDAHVQRKMLDPEKYCQILATVEVGVFFHNRQQALGNIFTLLAMGKKVYVRSDTTTYDFLKLEGLPVYDSYDLLKKDFSLNNFLDHIPATNQNGMILNLLSDERAEQEWRFMLNDIISNF